MKLYGYVGLTGRDWLYLHVCKQPCLQVNNNKCLRQYIIKGDIAV